MPTQQLNLEQTSALDQLLLAIIGVEGSGKSRLAATARKPILFFDTDGRIGSVAGTKGIYAFSYRDAVGTIQPDVFPHIVQQLSVLEQNKGDLAYLGFNCEPGTQKVKTIVIDSLARFAKAAQRYALYGNKAMARTVSFSGMSVSFPGGFDAWNAEMSMIEETLIRVFSLGADVILTLHEAAEESPESTSDRPMFTGRVTVFPVRYLRLLGYFNEVWRLQRQGVIPTVTTQPDFVFRYAKTALNIDQTEEPDIEKLMAKHLARQTQTQTVTQNSAAAAVALPPGATMIMPTK